MPRERMRCERACETAYALASERAPGAHPNGLWPVWAPTDRVCYAVGWLSLLELQAERAAASARQGDEIVDDTMTRREDSKQERNGQRERGVELAGMAGAPDLGQVVARLDIDRAARKGIPEIVLAESKSDEQLVAIARTLVERAGLVIVSRARAGQIALLREALPGCEIDAREAARAAAIHAPGYARAQTGGHVGMLTAGTGDIAVAEEARLVAEEMGCRVTPVYDVGVAGIHRLFGPLSELLENDVDALVVCAGMDGALPSVVAGLSHAPVIGCPTSVGYGAGGKGRAALLSMLQTCAPGLTVVNIDNGVGAGATAALIANRMARARNGR
jgi:pyridinium-3,5-biscarboxylic acid mononucleotide synthase